MYLLISEPLLTWCLYIIIIVVIVVVVIVIIINMLCHISPAALYTLVSSISSSVVPVDRV